MVTCYQILVLPFIAVRTKNLIASLMEKEQPKKSKGNFYVGLIVGVIVYGIVKELIWPMISG